MIKRANILILYILCPLIILAQPAERQMTPSEYINNYKNDAIKEMILFNIPASITLAQGMLESGNGNSDLAMYANNHFGIKCHAGWNGPSFIKDDDEKDECFRKYSTVLESYTDHSNFLKSRSRYAHLFELKHTDYEGWAKGLKKAGYATDPHYPKRLIALIEAYKLHEYDNVKELNTLIHTPSKSSPEVTPIIQQASTEVREINRFRFIKYIVIKPGDTFYKIAKETDKDLWQLYKYNDLQPNDKLTIGEKLYLQPKRNRGKEPFHIVKKGETMHSISQLHGIKLKALYKKNNLKKGSEPAIGQELFLR